MSGRGDSIANGPGTPAWLRYDPLFAQIYHDRASFWREVEP